MRRGVPSNLRAFLRFVRPAVFLVLLLTAGCTDEMKRVAVYGTVKRENGEIVEAGGVSYLPDHGHNGPAANTKVEAGRYRFTSENGPTAGSYRVIVSVSPSKLEVMEATQQGKRLPQRRTEWIRDVTIPPRDAFENNFTLEE